MCARGVECNGTPCARVEERNGLLRTEISTSCKIMHEVGMVLHVVQNLAYSFREIYLQTNSSGLHG